MSNINFMESIKIVPDAEKEMLLKIQDKLEKEGITLENVLKLTKNLSNNEKQRLKQLYLEQIDDLNSSTENYKKKILKIKSDIQNSKKAN
ncbi:MAG: hypothetical protein ACI4VE_03610 [Clostridia bacterium]